MSISRVFAPDAVTYNSDSVTLSSDIQANDLIIIGIFTRSTVNTPSGYTATTPTSLPRTVDQREVLFYRTADGSEGGTTVEVNQAIGIFYAVYRNTSGAFVFEGDSATGEITTEIATGGTVNATSPYLAFSIGGNVYADGNFDLNEPSLSGSSDPAWGLVTTTGSGTNRNRLGFAEAFLSPGDSPTIAWTTENLTTNSWGVVVAAFSEPVDDTYSPNLTNSVFLDVTGTTAKGEVTTDESNGTLYAVVTQSSTAPTTTQIQAGQDHTGAMAAFATNQPVSTTGVQSVSASGLSSETTYYFHFQQQDSSSNDSLVATTSSFTTDVVPVLFMLSKISFSIETGGEIVTYQPDAAIEGLVPNNKIEVDLG